MRFTAIWIPLHFLGFGISICSKVIHDMNNKQYSADFHITGVRLSLSFKRVMVHLMFVNVI